MSRKNIWRGMTTLTASLLTVSVAAGPVVDSYRTDIDKFLGTKSSAMVTDSTDEDLYTYKSDYSSTTELLESIEDLGERMSEEGTVLLKNENNALPLTKDETQKLSLLGFSSYYPVQGGDMGSFLLRFDMKDCLCIRCYKSLTVDLVAVFIIGNCSNLTIFIWNVEF